MCNIPGVIVWHQATREYKVLSFAKQTSLPCLFSTSTVHVIRFQYFRLATVTMLPTYILFPLDYTALYAAVRLRFDVFSSDSACTVVFDIRPTLTPHTPHGALTSCVPLCEFNRVVSKGRFTHRTQRLHRPLQLLFVLKNKRTSRRQSTAPHHGQTASAGISFVLPKPRRF